jgi:hypothetical protein
MTRISNARFVPLLPTPEKSAFRNVAFRQGKDDFIENIDDMSIHYDGGRVAANEALKAEIKERGLRNSTKQTKRDRTTIRKILNGEKVKASTLARVVMGMREA